MSIEGIESTIIHNEESRSKIRRLVDDAVNCMVMSDGHKEAIKQIVETMKLEFQISPKHARSIIKRQYNQDIAKVEAEHQATVDLYESIYGSRED